METYKSRSIDIWLTMSAFVGFLLRPFTGVKTHVTRALANVPRSLSRTTMPSNSGLTSTAVRYLLSVTLVSSCVLMSIQERRILTIDKQRLLT